MRRRSFVTAAVSSASLPFLVSGVRGSNEPRGLWTSFGGDSSASSFVSGEVGVPEGWTVSWEFDTGGRVMSSPSFDGENLYVSSWGGGLSCLDRSSGKRRWSFEVPDAIDVTNFPATSGLESCPVVSGGSVYVAGYDGVVYRLDRSSGEKVWGTDTGTLIRASPLLAEGSLYVADWAGVLRALDVESGERLWRYDSGDDKVYSNPCYGEGKVFFGSMAGGFESPEGVEGGSFHAVDAATGEKSWTVDSTGAVASSPLYRDGWLFFGAEGGAVRRVDASTGEKSWTFDARDTIGGSAAVDGSRLYVGDWSGRLYCLSLNSGEFLWSFDADGSFYASGISATEDAVYVGDTEGVVYSIEPGTGGLNWTFEAEADVRATPVPVKDGLYVASEGGQVVKLEPGGSSGDGHVERGSIEDMGSDNGSKAEGSGNRSESGPSSQDGSAQDGWWFLEFLKDIAFGL